MGIQERIMKNMFGDAAANLGKVLQAVLEEQEKQTKLLQEIKDKLK